MPSSDKIAMQPNEEPIKFVSTIPNESGQPIQEKSDISKKKITREPDTEAKYLKRASGLLKTIGFVTGSSSIRMIPEWLASKRPSVSSATFRVYKASLMFYLESLGDNEEAIETIRRLGEIAPDTITMQGHGLSRRKKRKFIHEDELSSLVQCLRQSEKGAIVADWLLAGITVGARPSEWSDAEIVSSDEAGVTLKIINRKATNGRGAGATRTLVVPFISDDFGATVVMRTLNHIEKWKSSGKEFDKFIEMVRRALRSATKKAGIADDGKSITPYITRHQFSANAKNLKSREEVAALMGHASIETASIHYGKRKSGWKAFKDANTANQKNTFAPSGGDNNGENA